MSIRIVAGDCAPRPAPLFFPSRPLVPLAVAFACGIVIGNSIPAGSILGAAAICGLGVYSFMRGRIPIRVVTLCAFAAVGAFCQLGAATVSADDVSRFASGSLVSLEGAVSSEPELRGRMVSMEIAVDRLTVGDETRACSGRMACSLARGDGGSLPDYGDRIVARGVLEPPDSARNPGGFDSAAYLARRGIFCTFHARRPGAWSIQPERPGLAGAIHRLSSRLRDTLQVSASRHLSSIEASLLSGILIGTRTSLPPAIDDDFQLTGTAHILATAGLHVGLVALIMHLGLRGLGCSRRRSAGLIICALTIYALVAGGRPSVVRAVLVTNLFLGGYLLDREADGANSLACAALAILAIRPGALFDAGFQLSFATVGTILWVMPAIQRLAGELGGMSDAPGPRRVRIWERIRRYGATLACLTLAAQIGSAPLVAEYFDIVSPSGLPANLVIVPALVPILGLGLLFWLASAVSLPVIPEVLASALHPLLAFVIGAARTCSELPMASFPISSPGWLMIGAYYCLVGWLGWKYRRGRSAPPVVVSPSPAFEEAVP